VQAALAPDSSWIRFRTDPEKRLFPALPAARRGAPASPAAVWPVTNCADDGPGSLRAAVAGAADGDSIDLTALSCATITLQTGAIPVEVDNLNLDGPGRAALAIDGNGIDRVFVHPYGGTLTLRALTVQGGRISAEAFDVTGGGCIASAGYVVLEDSTVRDCYAVAIGAYGGGLYAYSLTMRNSTLSTSHARGMHIDAGTAAFGGGAFVYTMSLQDSTVSGNVADHRIAPTRTSYDIGGGIITVRGGFVNDSTIESNFADGRGGGLATFSYIGITNSTVSGNTAAASIGGGLFVRRPAALQISNSTLSANQSAEAGGGIWLASDSAELQSTLVYGNTSGTGAADIDDTRVLTIGGGNNLIGIAGASLTLPADTISTDPLLGPLAWNGGPTRTHALGAGSPAVDSGNNHAQLGSDQRGVAFPRVYGSAPDIGAFEQQGVPTGVVQTPVPAMSTWFGLALLTLLGLIAAPRAGALSRRRR
jgi:hypothetical protein